MKKIFFIMILTAATSGFSIPWHVTEAEFRLAINSTRPELIGYLDFSAYPLPILLAKGIDIRSADGVKIPFYLHQTLGLVIAPAPEHAERFIYFGLPETSPVDQWNAESGAVPEDRRLYAMAFARWHNHLTAKEWEKNQMDILDRRFKAQSRWMFNYVLLNILLGKSRSGLPADWKKPFDNEDFLCWRYRDRSRRQNWFTTQKMISSYANPYRPHSSRLNWAWQMIHLNYLRIYNNVDKLAERSQKEPLNSFKALFKFNPKSKPKPFFEGNLNSFQILTDSFDSRRHFGIVFETSLIVPETGEYDFQLETEAGAILYLDDKELITIYREHRSENPATTELEAGLHRLKLHFHRDQHPASMILRWRKPGTKQFELLSDDNFAPGWPNQPFALQNRKGETLPLVRRTRTADIFIEKLVKMNLINAQAVAPDTEFTWFLNGKPVATGPSVTMVCEPGAKLGAGGGKYPPTQLFWLGNRKIDSSPLHAASLRMQLHTPDFIFDDESQDMFVEAVSAMPFENMVQIETSSSRENPVFPSETKSITVPAKKTAAEERFAQDGLYKFPVRITGKELRSQLDVNLKLKMPGLVFAEKNLRFIPLSELPPLSYGDDGNFYDETGAQVIPVLHRPTLSELRKWELPILLRNQIALPHKMLVIADDFGSFSKTLADAFDKKNIQTELLQLPQEHILFAMRKSLIYILPSVKNSDADAALIIPSAFDLRNRIPVRSQIRTLSAILQALRENPEIKIIYMATPIPQKNIGDIENEMITELRRLTRDFGVKIINLNFHLRQHQIDDENYCHDPENQGYQEILPLKMIPEICNYLLSETIYQ